MLNLHMVAFSASAAFGADATLNALTDNAFTITNNDFLMRQDMQILEAWAGATTLTDARFNYPSIANFGDLYIQPIQHAAIPGSNPPVADWSRVPGMILAGEELKCKINDANTSAERATVLAVLCGALDTAEPVPMGRLINFKFTSTTTVTANAWTQIAITWATSPPPGVYAIVDLNVVSANGQAARLVMPPRIWKPGRLMRTNQYDNMWDPSSRYRWGVMGYFAVPNFPNIEVLCNGADAVFTGYLACKRMDNLTAVPASFLSGYG